MGRGTFFRYCLYNYGICVRQKERKSTSASVLPHTSANDDVIIQVERYFLLLAKQFPGECVPVLE